MLTSLTLLNYVQVDTEEEMLGYGIGIILLNIGMYFVAPAVLIVSLKKRLFLELKLYESQQRSMVSLRNIYWNLVQ